MKTYAKNMTIEEGKSAYILGSSLEDNPYKKAKEKMLSDLVVNGPKYDDNHYAILKDLECQWDSGFFIAKRNNREN